jgi:two-component system sensor histidine kinase SenX3
MNLSDVSLHQLTEQCAEVVRARHRLDPEEVQIDVDPALIVTTDRAALEIVVKNLIDNAVKYSARPAHVRVVARRDSEKKMTLEVRDGGIGIDRKNLKRVFHRFYRVEEQEVRERRGTGLGLFVVWALVKQLGGDVRAFSEGRGQGTTMRVELPLAHGVNAS